MAKSLDQIRADLADAHAHIQMKDTLTGAMGDLLRYIDSITDAQGNMMIDYDHFFEQFCDPDEKGGFHLNFTKIGYLASCECRSQADYDKVIRFSNALMQSVINFNFSQADNEWWESEGWEHN